MADNNNENKDIIYKPPGEELDTAGKSLSEALRLSFIILKTINLYPMKFQAVILNAAAIPPTFAQRVSDIPNWGPKTFTTKEAVATFNPRPIKVTTKNLENSFPIPAFSVFSKAQNLSPKYLAQVATIKEIPLNTEYQRPKVTPEASIKKFKTPKSVIVAKTPISKYFASWKIETNLFELFVPVVYIIFLIVF